MVDEARQYRADRTPFGWAIFLFPPVHSEGDGDYGVFSHIMIHRKHAGQKDLAGTALSGSISTVLTGLSWICAGICMCEALPSPVCA